MSHIMGRGGRGDVVTRLSLNQSCTARARQPGILYPLSHPTLAPTPGYGGILAKWFDKMSCFTVTITNQMFHVLILKHFQTKGRDKNDH